MIAFFVKSWNFKLDTLFINLKNLFKHEIKENNSRSIAGSVGYGIPNCKCTVIVTFYQMALGLGYYRD